MKYHLAREMIPCLERTYSVKKSAFSARGERPAALEHYESMTCEHTLISPPKIVLVDDVITKGRTMLAAASRVKEAFPDSTIFGFSVLRTMGLIAEIDKIIDPCSGHLSLQNGEVYRNP